MLIILDYLISTQPKLDNDKKQKTKKKGAWYLTEFEEFNKELETVWGCEQVGLLAKGTTKAERDRVLPELRRKKEESN